MNRPDGPAKVTGGARYAADTPVAGAVHAVLVPATIASGRVLRIDTESAAAAPGVLSVLTHLNMPRLERAPSPPAPPHYPMQDDRIQYEGQPVALVIAMTLEQAEHAARLVAVEYDAQPHLVFGQATAEAVTYDWYAPFDLRRGDVDAGLAAADVMVEQTYTMPSRHHNPMEPSATIAQWDGDRLTMHDATQWTFGVRTVMAAAFGIEPEQIRVSCPLHRRRLRLQGIRVAPPTAGRRRRTPPRPAGEAGAPPLGHVHRARLPARRAPDDHARRQARWPAHRDTTPCHARHIARRQLQRSRRPSEPRDVRRAGHRDDHPHRAHTPPHADGDARSAGRPGDGRPGDGDGRAGVCAEPRSPRDQAGVEEVTADGSWTPGAPFDAAGGTSGVAMRSFGAVFVEVAVDPDLGLVRMRRCVAGYSAGRIINPRTARSQMIGGIIWGYGQAVLEESSVDPALGRFLSKNLAGVLLPANADIADIDVFFVEEHDPHASLTWARGIGELGAVGIAPAIVNAVYHATGKWVRDLPIRIERLLGES
jgi:CO/xanthine dehydrogenase Mo-binding subunit